MMENPREWLKRGMMRLGDSKLSGKKFHVPNKIYLEALEDVLETIEDEADKDDFIEQYTLPVHAKSIKFDAWRRELEVYDKDGNIIMVVEGEGDFLQTWGVDLVSAILSKLDDSPRYYEDFRRHAYEKVEKIVKEIGFDVFPNIANTVLERMISDYVEFSGDKNYRDMTLLILSKRYSLPIVRAIAYTDVFDLDIAFYAIYETERAVRIWLTSIIRDGVDEKIRKYFKERGHKMLPDIEIKEAEVKRFASGAHVVVPKTWRNNKILLVRVAYDPHKTEDNLMRIVKNSIK